VWLQAGVGRDARLARVAEDGAVAAHHSHRALVGARLNAQEEHREGVTHSTDADCEADTHKLCFCHQKALNLRFRPVYLLSSGTSTPLPRICSFLLSTHCFPF
jgi:hypothetical protein